MGQLFKQMSNLGRKHEDASLLVSVSSRQCLDTTVGKIENGLECGFVKHRLNCLLITDPMSRLTYVQFVQLNCHILVWKCLLFLSR